METARFHPAGVDPFRDNGLAAPVDDAVFAALGGDECHAFREVADFLVFRCYDDLAGRIHKTPAVGEDGAHSVRQAADFRIAVHRLPFRDCAQDELPVLADEGRHDGEGARALLGRGDTVPEEADFPVCVRRQFLRRPVRIEDMEGGDLGIGTRRGLFGFYRAGTAAEVGLVAVAADRHVRKVPEEQLRIDVVKREFVLGTQGDDTLPDGLDFRVPGDGYADGGGRDPGGFHLLGRGW